MATVQVSTLDEFLSAITVSGDVVECPENAEWNWGTREPISETINVRCLEIKGNGTSIIGMQYNGSGAAFSFRTLSSWEDGANYHDLKLIDFRAYFTSADGIKPFLLCYYNYTPVNFQRCAASGIIYSNGNNDNNCFIAAIGDTFGLTMGNCSFDIKFPSGGVFFETTMGVTALDANYCRFEITTTSATSYGYNGFNPFVERGMSGFVFPPKIKNCEIILHAPNAERLEIHKSQSEHPNEYYNGAQFSGCVFRGETKSGATISAITDIGGDAKTSIFESTLGTLENATTYSLTQSATSETMRSYDDLSALVNRTMPGGATYPYNFTLGSGNNDWHTGEITINFGFPYIPSMIDIPTIELHPVEQKPYIKLFDIMTPQTSFVGNGKAILQPISCEVEESLNGAYTFSMQLPIDADGKWQLIQQRNLVMINGQIFTILQVTEDYSNGSGTISCSGEHIFYQLADGYIYPGDDLYGANGASYITHAKARTATYSTSGASLVYDFEGNSDLHPDGGIVKQVGRGCTLIDALIGSGGLIDQSDTGSAELYRYNFYYSINYRMEYAQDNAFDIRIGRDLQGIRRTVDTSQFVSYFRAYDKYGNWWAVSWVLNSFLSRRFPHHIVRSQTFSDIEVTSEYGFKPLVSVGMAFFRRNCKPIISYEIDLEDVRNNPDFSMIMGADRLKVGDSGTLYDERLGGKLEIRISGTTYDAVQDKIIRVTIGDQQHFSAPSAQTITVEPDTVGGELYIEDADGNFIADADDKLIYQEVVSDG